MAAPPELAGMSATGKSSRAPGFELHELISEAGLRHVAMVVSEAWRDQAVLGPDLQGRLGFMEQPEVGGLARLATYDADQAVFVYPTGTVWSVAEIVAFYADQGTSAGVKAGLELCYLLAESLVEAAEAGFAQGVFGHGNVNPWTLWIKQDGQPVILGYGVPQLELLAWRENPKIQLTEDSYRYAPPERVEGGSEDVSSDLLSLALVCLELMTGRPVYDGVVADVRQQAMRGEGVRRLYQWREKLPQNVREVMSRALKADPDTRFPSGMDFVHAVHDLLGSIDVEGPSLVEVMARVRASARRGRAAGRTGALSPQEMAELAADLDEIDDKPLPPPRRGRADDAPAESPSEKPRWGKVQRTSAAVTPAPAPEAERPRRRLRNDASSPVTQPVAAPPTDDPRERLRRRLRESAPSTNTSPVAAPITTPVTAPSTAEVLAPRSDDSVELDLAAPDDVQLEPLTGKTPAPDDDDDDAEFEVAPPRLDTGRVLANARALPTPAPADPRRSSADPRRSSADVSKASPRPDPRASGEVSRPLARASGDLPPTPLSVAQPPISAPPVSTAAPVSSPPAASPPPSSPPDADAANGEASVGGSSAAAALLERMRTSGGRRRRPNAELGKAADPPVAKDPAPSAPLIPKDAPPIPKEAQAIPKDAPPIAKEAQGIPKEAQAIPKEAQAIPKNAPWDDGTVEVSVGRTVVRAAGGLARDIAARVVAELALPTVDLTGRFAGVWRLYRDDRPLAPGAPVDTSPGLLHLRRVRTGLRPVRVALPDGRIVELPVETGLPARWVLIGLAEWGLLPSPEGARLSVAGRDLDPDETLAEALPRAEDPSEAPPLLSVTSARVS